MTKNRTGSDTLHYDDDKKRILRIATLIENEETHEGRSCAAIDTLSPSWNGRETLSYLPLLSH
jgi:hypothetical protein